MTDEALPGKGELALFTVLKVQVSSSKFEALCQCEGPQTSAARVFIFRRRSRQRGISRKAWLDDIHRLCKLRMARERSLSSGQRTLLKAIVVEM